MSIIILALLIFIAFTIGLNLGLHGLFLFPAETSAFESALNGEDRYIKNESSFKESNSIGKQSLLTKSMEQETTVQSKQIVEVEVKVALPEPIVRPSRPEISIVEVKLAQLKDRARSKMESSNVLGMVGQSAFWKVDVPIVLLTCNRPELLQGTIKSLLRVRGVSKKNILVSQDGTMQTVKSIVSDFGLSLVQNTEVQHTTSQPLFFEWYCESLLHSLSGHATARRTCRGCRANRSSLQILSKHSIR